MTGRATSTVIPQSGPLQWREPCPCCGGPVDVDEEARLLACRFCGRQHLRDLSSYRALLIPHRVNQDEMAFEIKRWLRKECPKATDLEDIVSILVPYWRLMGRTLVWGRASARGSAQGLAEGTEVTQHYYESLWPAVAGAPSALNRTASAGELGIGLPMDRQLIGEGVRVAALGTDPPEPLDGQGRVGQSAEEEHSLPLSPGDHELTRTVSLIYLPLHLRRYSLRSDPHTVVGCGITGRVLGSARGNLEETLNCEDEVPESFSSPPRHVLLRCPGCRLALRGETQTAVYRCRRCHRAWHLQMNALTETQQVVAKGEGRHFPFWWLEGTPTTNGSASTAAPRRVIVPAFSPCPPTLLRRLTITMSERNPEYEDGGVLNGAARPCTLSEVEATRVAAAASGELEADPYDEETGPIITGFEVRSSRVAWIPLRSEKGFLSDPVSGITISEGVFE